MKNTARKKISVHSSQKNGSLLSLSIKKVSKIVMTLQECFSWMSLEQPEKAYQRPVRVILQLNLGSKPLKKLGVAGRPKLAQKC